MSKKVSIIFFIVLFFSSLVVSTSYADNAEVLPKGVHRVSVDTNYYLPFDERYNPDGEVEDIAVDYNTSLNSNVFPALSLVESAFSLPPGSGSIGDSVVSLKYQYTLINLSFQYGVSDRFTAGINIPYWYKKNKVEASLDSSSGSSATVGKSAIGTALGAPLVPLTGGGPFGDAVPLTTEDVQNLLGGGLDTNGDGTIDIAGFGYKRFETWSDNGIGDIEAGFRYQYYKTDDWRLSFTGGGRLPTGEIDDPDNLTDLPLGEGAYVLLLRFNNDYTRIKNLVLHGTFRYDHYFSVKQEKRVPDDVNRPITNNKEEVGRKIGDALELEASGQYTLLKGLNLSLLYKYAFAFKDEVSGNLGFAYESLENETNYSEHVLISGLSYTTIPLYMENKFPLPLTASISYRNKIAGSNNALKSQYIAMGLSVLF